MSERPDNQLTNKPEGTEVQASALATAMAIRIIIESQYDKLALGQAVSTNPEETAKQVKFYAIGIDRVFEDSQSPSESIVDMSPAVETPAFEELIESSFEQSAPWYRKLRDGAENLAGEKGIDPTEVFHQDELYYEMVRSIDTPRDMAQRTISASNRDWNDLNMGKAAGEILEGMGLAPKGQGENLGTLMESLMQMPWVKSMLDAQVQAYKNVAYDSLVVRIERIWGQDGIDALPDDVCVELRIGLTDEPEQLPGATS